MREAESWIEPPPFDLPHMIWDGDCGFCSRWAVRLQKLSGDSVIFQPYQSFRAEFPQFAHLPFEDAVYLLEPNGRVCPGALAVFRFLYLCRRWRWLYRCCRRSQIFATACAWLYRRVANNRSWLSRFS